MTTDHESKHDDADELPFVKSNRREDSFDMDITPMIDITFLLLIFFLVCSTPDQQTAIELPRARYGKGVGERDSVMITIGDGGVDSAPVYLADGKIEEDRLTDDLNQQTELIRKAIEKGKRDNKENVLIKADRNVAHREVSRVIKTASKVEGMQIHLAVLESD